jgi:hypothetical protein
MHLQDENGEVRQMLLTDKGYVDLQLCKWHFRPFREFHGIGVDPRMDFWGLLPGTISKLQVSLLPLG